MPQASSESRPLTTALKSRELICLIGLTTDRTPATLTGRLVFVKTLEEIHDSTQWLSVKQESARSLSPQATRWHAELSAGQHVNPSNESVYRLEGAAGAALLSEMLQTDICYHATTLRKLYRGPTQRPRWEWSHDSDAHARIALQFSSETSRLIDLNGLHYLDEASGQFGDLALSRRVWRMLEHMPPIPPDETGLRAEWPPHRWLADIPPPPAAPALRAVHAKCQPILVMSASRDPTRGDHVFHLLAWADYGGYRVPVAGEPWRRQIIRYVAGEYVTISRDIDHELNAWASLADADLVDLGKLHSSARRTLIPAPPPHALGHRQQLRGGADTFAALELIVQSLSHLGFRLEYDPELPFTVLPEDTELRATLGTSERGAWTQFELAAQFNGGEINVLPIILAGLKRKAFSLTPSPNEPQNAHWLAPISPQQFLPLALSRVREWLTPLVECLHGPTRRDMTSVNLSRMQAVALAGSLQAHGIEIAGAHAAHIGDTLAALRSAQQSASLVTPPASFRGGLRSYQREGLQWLQALRQSGLGGVLADDMGLGKTVQVIAHLLLEFESGRLDRPALIIAPTSLVFNWIDEIARFAPSLRCLNFTGADRSARREQRSAVEVVIISYALLPIEMEWLDSIDYSMLVLDEAQWIKNPFTRTGRAVRRLRASHRLAVTGTPLENHLGELWAHMDAVVPGVLGDYRSFKRSFRVPIEQYDDDTRMTILRQRLAPFLLRRSKAAVAPELPLKSETVLRVAMAEDQRQLYESLRLSLSKQVRDALAHYGEEQSRIVVLSALLRLRQVCCDPRLLGQCHAGPSSAKLAALLQLIRSLRDDGRHVLVFSQFTSMLKLISTALTNANFEHLMLTGETTDRGPLVRRFQRREVPILLASLKAGGVGLNLTTADAVIHYDPWWNPAVELQAVDRAHRLGREHPVFVYKLICDDTIEEKIEHMKERKSHLAQSLLDDGNGSSIGLGELDVVTLFGLSSPA
jgi:superfamily II DNA or RNA helicase